MTNPRITIRQSELSSWADCRRRTVLNYWEGYNRKRNLLLPPSKADIGTIVHGGLEHHYRGLGSAHGWVAAEALRVEADWAPFEMTKEWKDAYNLAYIMCEGYEQWLEETGADAGFVVTGVERECEVFWGTIDGYDVYVTGHIDLEGIDALGRPVLVDHKSVVGLSEPEGPHDFQRASYAVLRRMEDGTVFAALLHNQLRRVKRTARATPPFYGRNEVQFNDAHLRKHYRHMDVLVREIVAHERALIEGRIKVDDASLYPHPTKDCSWKCPMFNVCPMMDDGGDWEWYLSEVFDKGKAHVPGRNEEE